jgi:hypothetical protein
MEAPIMTTTARFRWSRRLLAVATVAAATFALGGAVLHGDGNGSSTEGGGVTVSLCDGESRITVPGLEPGKVLPPAEARQVAGQMMQVWRRNRGEEAWSRWASEMATATPARPAQAPAAAANTPAGQAAQDQPVKFSKRDELIWKREQDKWIAEGYKNFHNAQALGGTIGISCDMCHPDATNTHPETYPKFQMQIKKVSLLRDMVNWCIENPMKGKPLPEDDPRLRSVEAYILSARKGVPLEAGKH